MTDSILPRPASRRFRIAQMFFRLGAMTVEQAMAKSGPWYNFIEKSDFRRELKEMVKAELMVFDDAAETYALTSPARSEFRRQDQEEADVHGPKVLPPYRPPFKPLQTKHIPSLHARRHDAQPPLDRPRFSAGVSSRSFLEGWLR